MLRLVSFFCKINLFQFFFSFLTAVIVDEVGSASEDGDDRQRTDNADSDKTEDNNDNLSAQDKKNFADFSTRPAICAGNILIIIIFSFSNYPRLS